MSSTASPPPATTRLHGAVARLVASMPRDVRDTLYLLAVVAWVVLVQAAFKPLWVTGAALGLLVWRGWITLRQRPLPTRMLRVALLVVVVAGVAVQFRTIAGKDAGSALVVLLLALKTLELRARRDAFVIFFLGFFALLSCFFYSQSLLSAAGILPGVLALLAALVNAQLQAGTPPLRQSWGIALRMAALGTPLMLALFVLFPRFAPLWGLPADDSAKTGLSEDMTVGNIAQLAQDDSVALRVRFDGDIPAQAYLYFRGPVLERFDGRRWSSWLTPGPFFTATTASAVSHTVEAVGTTPAVQYEMLLEPHQRQWLLLLDMPTQPPTMAPGWRARQAFSLEWFAHRPIISVLRYQASAHLDYRTLPAADMPRSEVLRYTATPADSNPRTRALAQSMRADPQLAQADASKLVAHVLERLRTGGYTYTLEPIVTGNPHAADDFWFNTREGFCEHISNAFVILMRNLGVPARIVTGYQGGEVNLVDGLLTVRQLDAHAWAEVWMPTRGWVRVDPTASVADWRIGSATRMREAPGIIGAAVERIGMATQIAASLRNLWDATNTRWNNWVLNYTQDRQFNMLRHIGIEDVDWVTLVQALAALLLLLATAGGLWALWDKRQRDPWLRLLQQAETRLLRIRPPHTPPRHNTGSAGSTTPRQWAHLLHQYAQHMAQAQAQAHTTNAPANPPSAAEHPAWLPLWTQWLLELEAIRYARPTANTPPHLHNLRQRLRQLPAIPMGIRPSS